MLTTVAADRTAPRAHRGRHAATLPVETALVVVPAVSRTLPGADERRNGGRVRAGATSGRARPVPRRALNGRVPAPPGFSDSLPDLRLRVVLLLRGSVLARRLSETARTARPSATARRADKSALISRQVVATGAVAAAFRTARSRPAAHANFPELAPLLGPPARKVVREGPQAVLLFLAAVVARDSARPLRGPAQGDRRQVLHKCIAAFQP